MRPTLLFLALLLVACEPGTPEPGPDARNYYGTQSPGDVWEVAIDSTAFTAANTTLGLNYSGTVSVGDEGFTDLELTTTDDPSIDPTELPWSLRAFEFPDVAILVQDPGDPNTPPIVAVATGDCPTAAGDWNYIHMPEPSWDPTGTEAVGLLDGVPDATGMAFTNTQWSVDGGTTEGPNSMGSWSCTDGVLTTTEPDFANISFAATSSGAFIGDLGPNEGAVIGMADAGVMLSDVVDPSKEYRGFQLRSAATDGEPRVGVVGGQGNGTDLLGWPYSETSTGLQAEMGAGELATFVFDETIWPQAGIFGGGSSTDPQGNNAFVFIAGIVASKVIIFGLGAEDNGDDSDPGVEDPWNFVVIEVD
jgi:hypothetical protein